MHKFCCQFQDFGDQVIIFLMGSLYLGSPMMGRIHHHHRRSNSSLVLASPWFVPSLGSVAVSPFYLLLFTFQQSHIMSREVIIQDGLQYGSISPQLVFYVSIGVSCRYGILMRSLSFTVYKFCCMIDLVVSIDVTLGASSKSSWFWQTQHWSVATIL